MGLRNIYLLDTNIISEPTKTSPHEKVLTLLDEKGEFSTICSTVWYELLKGIEILPEGKKKKSLEHFVNDYVQSSFSILPYDSHCASIQADIYARMLQSGTPVPYYDMQIAATALANNLIIVTRNVKDFEPIQKEYSLMIENWFE